MTARLHWLIAFLAAAFIVAYGTGNSLLALAVWAIATLVFAVVGTTGERSVEVREVDE